MRRKTKRTIKCGKLYYYPIDCPDIERFFLRRLLRKFNIAYIPFTLRFYDRLFLREDKSKFNRVLVEYCKRKGIETIVVHEGGKEFHPYGHLPLRADYFLCPEECYQPWIDNGMPKGQTRIYRPQRDIRDIEEILFLPPFILDDVYTEERAIFNVKLIKTIERFKREQVAFRLYPRDCDITEVFLPKHRIVNSDPEELIKRYDKIYCFKGSDIPDICKKNQKPYQVVDE